jgi:hypothetical protein
MLAAVALVLAAQAPEARGEAAALRGAIVDATGSALDQRVLDTGSFGGKEAGFVDEEQEQQEEEEEESGDDADDEPGEESGDDADDEPGEESGDDADDEPDSEAV